MYTLGEIAKFIDATVVGDSTINIESIASINIAKNNQLTYIATPKYKQALITSKASAVILNKELLDDCPTNALIVDDVYLSFAKITHYFKKTITHQPGIHPSAKIHNAIIANNCVIGENVIIGNNCKIGANSIIENNVVIGDNTHLHSNVAILHSCSIGNNVVISPGVVIGSEGFGNARDKDGCWHAIVHLGNVIIGDDVTIGANTTIDRGTLEDTQIHNGVRLDNLIQIAHNVIIGENTAIAASTAIAGSAVLGKRCMIGGMVGIIGHLSICDDVIISGKSTVDKHIKKPGIYTGIIPLMPHKQWQNVGIWLVKLDKIVKYLNIKLKKIKD